MLVDMQVTSIGFQIFLNKALRNVENNLISYINGPTFHRIPQALFFICTE